MTREQWRDYYHRNKDQRNKAVARNVRRLRERRTRLINEYKNKPCADCGGTFHFSAMDFDHRPNTKKLKEISRAIHLGWSWERIEKEIAKCDIVCANCHRVRSWKRLQSKRSSRVAERATDNR